MSRDTIFALATPLAKSGVAVIRLSGGGARGALAALTGHSDWTPNMTRYVTLRTPEEDAIDKGLAIYFASPKSFTGEDVAEFHVHGSLSVIRALLDRLGAMEGLRPAEPGEFTRRAFLNGKMDLLEAEGLADLIEAETPAQRAQAMAQMGGDLSRYYEELRKQAVQCLALLEAYIDFPDEDIPESVLKELRVGVVKLQDTIGKALADEKRGERLREGIRVVIVGAPNVGKSSLLNALAHRDAAIVSQHAGTTRDVIEVHINIGGFPVILTDTAGLRESTDEIEEEGVRRALKRAQEADVTLVIFDATQSLADSGAFNQVTDKSIIIINKCDLNPAIQLQEKLFNNNILHISAKTGEGVDVLLKLLEERILSLFSSGLNSVITRQRHRAHLQEALACLERFSLDAPLEIACEELRRAAESIGKITGKIAVDELLDAVFKQFCIGK